MTEIVFTNLDVLKPAILWLITDLMIYPEIASSIKMPDTVIDKTTLETDYQVLSWILLDLNHFGVTASKGVERAFLTIFHFFQYKILCAGGIGVV